MPKLNHPPGQWTVGGTYNTHNHPTRYWETSCQSPAGVIANTSGTSREEAEGNARLIALAPTAPHHCEVPNCPGDVNRRKLEAFEQMREALRNFVIGDQDPSDTLAERVARTVLIEADALAEGREP